MAFKSAKGKKRNYRKRRRSHEEEEGDRDANGADGNVGEGGASGDGTEGLSIQEILEAKKFEQRERARVKGLRAEELMAPAVEPEAKKRVTAVESIGGIPIGEGGLLKKDKTGFQLVDEQNAEEKVTVDLSNFAKQTDANEVDKRMLQYIEDELAKERGEMTSKEKAELIKKKTSEVEDLYKMPEHLNVPEGRAQEIEEEGGMGGNLTQVTEVELPMEYKLANIERTEQARLELLQRKKDEAKTRRGGERAGVATSINEEGLLKVQTEGGRRRDDGRPIHNRFRHQYEVRRKDLATDDIVASRFRKFQNSRRR